MRLGKNKDEQGSSPDEELEQKVDAMMDLRYDEAKPDKIIKPQIDTEPAVIEDSGTPPAIDIFQDTKTAPEVPKKLQKGISPVKKEPAKPEPEKVIEIPDSEKENSEEAAVAEIPGDPLADPQTDKAVDEITRAESDKALATEDAEIAKAFDDKKPSFKQKVKSFFTAWWANKWARRGTIVGIILLVIGIAILPVTRYFILNTVGVRSSASIKVLDQSSGLPLKNVTVTLGTTETKTNGDGVAAFRQIKLGAQTLLIERVAFAPVKKKVTVGWGSNPLPGISLKAVGAQYKFNLNDYLSAKPIEGAEITSGESSAFVDKKGKVILTLDNPESDTIEATIKAKDYRTEKLSFAANTKTAFDMRMVPAKPVVYVSKQSGKYDVYKVDVDGKNKQMLLAGTGSERREMSIATSPDGAQAVLVSSRGKKRDASGYLLDTVTLIDTKSGQAKEIDEAQNIKLVDWVGNKLVYVATYAAPSAGYSQRQRIVAYDTEDSARNLLVTSDYFNGVASVGGSLYYAVANSDPAQPPSFSKIRIDGSNKQMILNKHVATVVRTSESTLSLETPEGWYDYRIGDNTARKGNPPADPYASRQYFMAPGGSKSAWVDNRDGKGVVLLHEKTNDDEAVVTASGVTIPVVWLSKNTILYRINNTNETADYVKNIDGGEPKKITDVTATSGLLINY